MIEVEPSERKEKKEKKKEKKIVKAEQDGQISRRMGAILSPTVAGMLLDGGWQPLHLYGVFASVFVLAAGCLLLLRPAASTARPVLADA